MEYAIGIDLGGTSIKYALVDKAGNSFFEGKLPSFASVSAAKVIEQLIKAVMLLKDEAAKQNWTVLGIGLGTPGIVDETNRIVLGGAENIIGWENIDVASLLEEQMKLPVVVGNDANLMGLGLKDEAAKQNWTVLGIGLGTPGIVDETNRIVLGGAENIIGWENIDVASLLEEQMKLPVVVGNDANLMGLGEAKYGAGRGCTHVVFLTVGTGIGGAVIIDGKLFNGYANRGTELGHVPLIANGERCACGAIGCLEHYASTSALVRHFSTLAKERNLSFDMEINGELIVRLYHENFPMAVECMSEHFYYLGRGIAGFVNIFSPQRIVLGGGVTESGIFYLEKIREVVREHVIADCALNTEIVAASLGNKAGFIGAASLILK